MLRYTKFEFRTAYGFEAAWAFDVIKFLTAAVKVKCMQNPTAAIRTKEYGKFLKQDGVEFIFFALEMSWWIRDGRQQARIEYISIFEDESEYLADKDITKVMQPTPVTSN